MSSPEEFSLKNIEKNKQPTEKPWEERLSELGSEVKKYSAKEGIIRAISEIERLLKSQKFVVMTICGSAHDVGRTYISSAIEIELIQRDISFATESSIGIFSTEPVFREGSGEGRVLMFQAIGPIYGPAEKGKRIENKWLKREIKERKFKIPISKIDIRVYVYRPDKPFSKDVDLRGADILIKNEGAFDDPRKMRG